VVVITSRWHSAYPAAAHERRGTEVGLPAATVEAIMAGLPASFSDVREQVGTRWRCRWLAAGWVLTACTTGR